MDRFKGRYADPDRANERHVFWVSETCLGSGHLMAGAEWGDVAPWILRSESQSAFGEAFRSPGMDPLRFEVELGAEGPARSYDHPRGVFEPTRLERLGDLPEGWQPEGDDCRYR